MSNLLGEIEARFASRAGSLGDLGDVGRELAGAAIGKITFRSQVSPEVEVDPFAAPEEQKRDAPPSAFLGFVRPAVTLETAVGTRTIAPYGEPDANYFPLFVAGAGVLGLLTLIGGITAISWLARKL